MKKLIILAFAALLVFAFTVPAAAVEHQFGGYWRTRIFMQSDFSGKDETVAGAGADVSRTDTRTRLYYTAVINDNLKFINKFEFDAIWGGQDTTFAAGQGTGKVYGDVGADGVNVEIKNSYVEFNWLSSIWRVGVQGWELSRGFQFSDDAAGVLWMYPWGNHLVGAGWVKVFEGRAGYNRTSEEDIDFPAIFGVFNIGEGMSLNPWFAYGYSDKGGSVWRMSAIPFGIDTAPIGSASDGSVNAWWIGCDYNWNTDMYGLWLTGIYLGGSMAGKLAPGATSVTQTGDWTLSGYLAAIGGHWNLGAGDIHGQFFYSSGDDNPTDTDWEQFAVFQGQSYYWAEIMGLGTFDNQVSNNAPADQIQNIYALNLGIGWTFAEKHKIVADIWYATRPSVDLPIVANAFPDEYLGTEIDLKYTYPIVEGMNLDIIGAYLFAGDGTYKQVAGGASSANPYELGMQLSLSF